MLIIFLYIVLRKLRYGKFKKSVIYYNRILFYIILINDINLMFLIFFNAFKIKLFLL